MSFQLPTATALPAEVQLAKEKPQGAFCLRTRYALSANSANSWVAGTLVSLPLQTGTPGTFTDVKQGCINCTIQVTNTNPYVDYLNFGPSGAMIFFDEMRVYSSGTPVEENLRYSETVDLLMNQGGWQSKPYHVYRRNKWRAANGQAGALHCNFIKPSMVDSTGCPMFGRTPFMDKNSSVYQPPAFALGTFQNVVYNNTAIDGGYRAASILPYAAAPDLGAVLSQPGMLFGLDSLGPFFDGGFSNLAASQTDLSAAGFLTTAKPVGAGLGAVGRTAHIASNAAVNRIGDQSFLRCTQYGRSAPGPAAITNNPFLPAAQYVPSQWPDYQPATLSGEVDDDEVDILMGKSKTVEYMKYLSNVRSLPIGVSGDVSVPYTSNLAAAIVAGADNCRNFTEYRVSMPFLSGIYGVLAEKMFPDLLIGANNIRIEFKLASNLKAFWLTMDPCRRVPGTVRDFAPFTGSASGAPRLAAVQNSGLSGFGAAANSAVGCFYANVYPATNAAAIAGFTGGVAANAASGGSIVAGSHMFTTAAALGQDLVPSMQNVSTVQAASNAGLTFANLDPAAGNGYSLTTRSNLPKPQYVPLPTPWLYKVPAAGNVTYATEAATCYGTYLPASVPQSRRCSATSRLAIADGFTNTGTTSFQIKDLQYIGEQVQLDDISAAAIISQAAAAEIVVWTKGYRSFEANCDTNEQQNIILPIQIGQATAMYLVFRPSNILTSSEYYSNSFVCPFVGLGFSNVLTDSVAATPMGLPATVPVAPHVGGYYTLKSSLDTASMGSFSYQLFSGTKQYPLQPIQTVSELLVEREKSVHSLHNWAWASTDRMALTQWGTDISTAAGATGLQFDPFLDQGYFTTFVPIAALDDQTITANPYFSLAEYSEAGGEAAAGSRIRGIRQPAFPQTGSQTFVGVLNKFVPPIGTFFLGWDFESWTNHEDLMRTGKFLGQEQLSVRMTGCKLMASDLKIPLTQNAGATSVNPIGVTAIVPHIVKMSFVPGGHMLTYY
jgi:hypothetical protein